MQIKNTINSPKTVQVHCKNILTTRLTNPHGDMISLTILDIFKRPLHIPYIIHRKCKIETWLPNTQSEKPASRGDVIKEKLLTAVEINTHADITEHTLFVHAVTLLLMNDCIL